MVRKAPIADINLRGRLFDLYQYYLGGGLEGDDTSAGGSGQEASMENIGGNDNQTFATFPTTDSFVGQPIDPTDLIPQIPLTPEQRQQGFLASGAAGGARLPTTLTPQERQQGFLASGAAGGASLPTSNPFLASGAGGNTRIRDLATIELNEAQLAKSAAEGASPQIMAAAQNRLDQARANEIAAYRGVGNYDQLGPTSPYDDPMFRTKEILGEETLPDNYPQDDDDDLATAVLLDKIQQGTTLPRTTTYRGQLPLANRDPLGIYDQRDIDPTLTAAEKLPEFTPGLIKAGVGALESILPAASVQRQFSNEYFPLDDIGRVAYSPADSVFGGKAAVSGLSSEAQENNLFEGAQKRIDNIEKTIAKQYDAGKTPSQELIDRADKFRLELAQAEADKKEFVRENLIADRNITNERIRDKKMNKNIDALAAEYDYESKGRDEDGGRAPDPTTTSKVNKAKAQINMPQNLSFSTGGGNEPSGNTKIVCTMMNESYGFGSFRNKIWMKFHKDLSSEYQTGYHKLFLPLVNYAKKDGITNKIVKKILEHIAVHSTIDMRQATRNKKHLIGRVYRKILLPLCYWVGKSAKR